MTDETAAADPKPCPPCRGTGQLVSKLGGEPHSVTCAWCDGAGELIAGHDAQAARREAADEAK